MMRISRRTIIGSALALPALRSAQAVMRIAIGTSLATLDPLKTTIGDEYLYDNLVFNGLTQMHEDLSVGPDLASSWSYSGDLKTWTFVLRRGVKFHNGTELVADDVIALFTRLLDPKNAAPSRSNYDMIDRMSAPDAYTVVFELKYPYGG